MPQRIKGRYEILQVIGQGGMGAVYRALDTRVGHHVAIKTIRDRPDETALRMFHQEIAVLARLSHPNIVEITDVGEFEENGIRKPYLVMPLLQGRSLNQLLAQNGEKLTVERSAWIVVQVCRGLQAAHEEKLLHRDIKPGNILVLANDWVKIIDFGLARMVDVKSTVGHKGTLSYMSPEQIDLKEPTARSDIFSLGVVFYEMLARKHPFEGETPESIAYAIRFKKPPLVSTFNSSVNDSVCRIIHKALAKDPRNRFATAKDLADNLEKAIKNEPIAYFDLSKIQSRLEKAKTTLQKGDLSLVSEILDDMEAEGYTAPEIDTLRTEVEEAERKRRVQQLLENAHKYFALTEYTLALQRLHELLELDPNHEEAKKLKIKVEDQLQGATIENWLSLGRTHLENNDFENARLAVQNVSKLRAGDPAIEEVLAEIDRREKEFKRLSVLKEELYTKSLEALRGGNLSSALQKAEELIKLSQMDKKENTKFSNLYNQVKSTYETLSRKLDEAKRLLSEKKFAQVITICNEVLAQNPKNLQFQALIYDAEDKQRQDRSAFIAEIDRAADNEPDLNRRIQILEDGLQRYPDEARFLGALKVAREKAELVKSIVANARMHEEKREFSEAISQFETLRMIYPNYSGLDFEIDHLKKRRQEQLKQETKSRLIETIDRNLSQGLLDKALELIYSAFQEFPEDPELEQLEKEVVQAIERKRAAEDLLNQARQFLQDERYQEAIATLDQAGQLDPKNLNVKSLLVDSLLPLARQRVSDDWKEAERLLQRVFSIDKNNEQAGRLSLILQDKKREESISRCLAQAREFQSSGQLEPAERVLRGGLKEHPKEPRLSQLLGVIRKARAEQGYKLSSEPVEKRLKEPLPEDSSKETDRRGKEDPQKSPVDSQLLGQGTVVREYPTQEESTRESEDSVKVRAQRSRERRKAALIGALFGLLLLASVIGYWVYRRMQPQIAELSITSSPSGARVYINGEYRGTTELKIPVTVPRQGDHQLKLKLTLENYQDYEDSLILEPNRSYPVGPVTLNAIPVSSGLEEIYDKALKAYQEAKLLEPPGDNAFEYASHLIDMDAENQKGFKSKAVELKQKIKDDLKARLGNLSVPEKNTEKELELLENINKVDPEDKEIIDKIAAFPGMVDGLKKQIEMAIAKSNFFPPDNGNALDLLNKLRARAPTREKDFWLSKRRDVQAKAREVLREKCKMASEDCTNFGTTALKYFPKDTEYESIIKAAPKAGPPPTLPTSHAVADARITQAMTKMEDAFRNKQFVLPERENAIYYATEVLRFEGNHTARALDIRNESQRLAVDEANRLSSRDRYLKALNSREEGQLVRNEFEKALKIQEALHSFKLPGDLRFSIPADEIKKRLAGLESLLAESKYEVVHLHFALGGCKGNLLVNGYGIKFISSEKPKDNFDQKYAGFGNISQEKEKLVLTISDKTWKFKPIAETESRAQNLYNTVTNFRNLRNQLAQP